MQPAGQIDMPRLFNGHVICRRCARPNPARWTRSKRQERRAGPPADVVLLQVGSAALERQQFVGMQGRNAHAPPQSRCPAHTQKKNVCSLAQDSLKYAEKVLQRITMGRYCISCDDARGRTGVLPIQWNPIQRIPNAHA